MHASLKIEGISGSAKLCILDAISIVENNTPDKVPDKSKEFIESLKKSIDDVSKKIEDHLKTL